jgi:hypothetical protein
MMSQMNPNSKPDRSPIAPVKTREELISLLSGAAELEHSLAVSACSPPPHSSMMSAREA